MVFDVTKKWSTKKNRDMTHTRLLISVLKPLDSLNPALNYLTGTIKYLIL